MQLYYLKLQVRIIYRKIYNKKNVSSKIKTRSNRFQIKTFNSKPPKTTKNNKKKNIILHFTIHIIIIICNTEIIPVTI